MEIVTIGKAVLRRKSDGKFLILRSSKWEERPDRSQQPDLPGGLIEEGETVEEGCAREINEEAGIVIDPADLTLAQAYSYVLEDKKAINRLIFYAEVDDPEVTLSWEHEAAMWLSTQDVLDLEIRDPYPETFRYLNKIGLLV